MWREQCFPSESAEIECPILFNRLVTTKSSKYKHSNIIGSLRQCEMVWSIMVKGGNSRCHVRHADGASQQTAGTPRRASRAHPGRVPRAGGVVGAVHIRRWVYKKGLHSLSSVTDFLDLLIRSRNIGAMRRSGRSMKGTSNMQPGDDREAGDGKVEEVFYFLKCGRTSSPNSFAWPVRSSPQISSMM